MVVPSGTLLWRVHFTGGRHATRWNELRHFGPLDARFDHHLPPAQVQDRGILYCSDIASAALAEVFQSRRIVNRRRRGPRLIGFRLTSAIEVLDLCGTWPTRAGASQALSTGSRKRARLWSQAVYEQYPTIVGLRYPTKMHGGAVSLALYERARGALAPTPNFDRALSDGAMTAVLLTAAADLGYAIV